MRVFRVPGVICGVVAVAVFVLQPLDAFAWGNLGHYLVARIAAAHLTPAARAQVANLLKDDPTGHTLRDVAVWADVIREQPRDGDASTKRWHFVDIPLTAADYDSVRDCKHTKNGECVLNVLRRQSAILADPNAAKPKRRDALKFIVHCVGDMNQPLHCADDHHDGGGNGKSTRFMGQSGTLHEVWDYQILNEAKRAGHLSEYGYFKRLDGGLPADLGGLQSGSFVDWATEAHRLAVTNAYALPAPHGDPSVYVLGKSYYATNRPIVEDQVVKAGVRLARILNELLQ